MPGEKKKSSRQQAKVLTWNKAAKRHERLEHHRESLKYNVFQGSVACLGAKGHSEITASNVLGIA